jgi:predicted HTH transcriptional regulator
MEFNVDLKELSSRESERVEWKENGEDKNVVNSIVKTISAFANDIANFGGGYVICGAKETKDEFGFPKVLYTGLSSEKLKEIEGKVLQHCRDYISPSVAPIVQELDNPDDKSTRILVFIILASPDAHTYRDGESVNYYVRISKDTKEARNGILSQLLVKKQKLEYFDKRVSSNANETDIDVLIFRDSIQEMGLFHQGKSLEDYFSDREQIAELVPPLFVRNNFTGLLQPRNFSLLMFGKKSSITSIFPEAHTIVSIYKGLDRSEPTSERHTLTGSIIEQAKKANELLNTQAYMAFDKTSMKPNQVKYPIRALQEALINAVVHRDYEVPHPIRITIFADRIEIVSPGSLHWGVDKIKFLNGTASPKWRNQSFAYLFNKLQLAQSEGQGIPTIFRTMKEEGCPVPIFEIETESVTCILPAHPRHQIIREQQEIQDMIILEKYDDAKEKTKKLLEKDIYNFRSLDLFCEILTKLRLPNDLFEFLTKNSIDLYSVNSNTLINFAELLSSLNGKEHIQFTSLANRALSIAMSGKVEESQIVKAVINLKKVGEPEDVIKFVSDAISKYPNLNQNATLLQKRATAKMDEAKKCINTGKDFKSSTKTQARAWDMCRQLLSEAERDLSLALENSEYQVEKDFIQKDIVFLETMKKQSRKPESR